MARTRVAIATALVGLAVVLVGLLTAGGGDGIDNYWRLSPAEARSQVSSMLCPMAPEDFLPELIAKRVDGEMTVYLRSSDDVQSIDDMIDQSDFEAKFTIRERVDGAGVGHIGNRSRAYLETIDRDACWPLSGGALVRIMERRAS